MKRHPARADTSVSRCEPRLFTHARLWLGTLEEQEAFLALPVHEDSEAAAEAASSSSLLTVAFGDAMAPLERAYQPGSRLGWSGDGEAEGAALRFGVGARVECQMGAGRWAPGRVTEVQCEVWSSSCERGAISGALGTSL